MPAETPGAFGAHPRDRPGRSRAGTPLRYPVLVGALLGLIGGQVFATYHWFYILEIEQVFLLALVEAPIGGAVVGWAYHRCVIQPTSGHPAWGPWAFGGVFAASLVPFEVVGLLFGPFQGFNTAREFLTVLPVAFLGVPVALVLGRYLTGAWRTAWILTLATTLLHFEMGGSLAFFGGTGSQLILFLGLLVLYTGMGPALALGVAHLDERAAASRPT